MNVNYYIKSRWKNDKQNTNKVKREEEERTKVT